MASGIVPGRKIDTFSPERVDGVQRLSRFNNPWGYGVRGDSTGAELHCQRHDHADDASLGGCVLGMLWPSLHRPGYRRDGEEPPVPGSEHVGKCCPEAAPRPAQIEINRLTPGFIGKPERGHGAGNPGVGNDNVQSAEGIDGGLNAGIDRARIADIHALHESAVSARLDLLPYWLYIMPVRRVPTKDDVSTGRSHGNGGGGTDPRGPAGNQRHPSIQPEWRPLALVQGTPTELMTLSGARG